MEFTRRKAALSVAAVMFAAMFTGCGSTSAAEKKEKLSIVCTDFSEYDWTRNIVGESGNTDITYLLSSGIDIHNYQPSVDDMMTISNCDMFIYVGGESESWVDDALKNSANKNMKVVKLFDTVRDQLKEEELKEGMEGEHEEHSHTESEPEYDEHVWLSVRNAQTICSIICDDLCELDAANADKYRSNLSAYSAELSSLDKAFRDMADNASTKTVLFGDRFPFRYLVDDYGIDYYAAFAGCSAESEASFETVAKLAGKLDDLKLDTVFIIENSDDSLARSIINNSKNKNAAVEKLNSLQSVTDSDIADGAAYISIMQDNLDTLKKVLD
ncbi:MAG: metal ABC transporter substrate-binding protein [Ruminococcus sp.]|uniref:metal ABC transporter substrate-binding protein n=1 Tax=Ruminococcus sp. TaxID=41978 RepID=UPI0025D2A9C5|nr:metal ABC transporter substrate-binding protein [Ruminococcus sp.]MCR5601058.1 metal ABC transporter substrate-binding protein [Ruminococcus sp.]